MTYDNTNRGALFKNNRKNSDSHPDYQGNINVDGVEYWLSGWIKTPKKGGDKFVSLSIKPKNDSQESNNPAPARNPVDDDIPF